MYKLREGQEGQQLSVQIMRRILREMKSGAYQDMSRLPPEVEMAESLGVSRTVVRDSLSILEREGFVTRKHGLGTIINRHVLSVTTRIDLEKEFLAMVREAGFTATVPLLDIHERTADETLARAMELEVGDEVICVDRLICADGVPTIYCEDYLAKKLIKHQNYTREDLEKPIFDFLNRFCDATVYLDLTELRAINADGKLAQIMQVEEGAALMHLNERGYSVDGRLILYSREFYRDGVLNHTILRIKI